MIQKKCSVCGTDFFLAKETHQPTCSVQCGYKLLSKKNQIWTAETIVTKIKELHNQGVSLNYSYLDRNGYKGLLMAAQKYCGGWKAAVKQAGFEPLRKSWDKNTIIQIIRDRWHAGQPVHSYAVRQENSVLAERVRAYFSSWDDMLAECGIPSQQRYQQWSKERVLGLIKRQHSMRLPMHLSAARKRSSKLYAASQRLFGSWKQALAEAGIKDEQSSKWSAATITKWLKIAHKRSISLNSNTVQKYHGNFYQAAVRYFRSWDRALESANIDPLCVKKSSFWTSDLVIRRIQERHRDDKPLFHCAVKSADGSLFLMAKHFFGTWQNAVEKSGFVYKHKRPDYYGEKLLGWMLRDFLPGEVILRHYRGLDWLINRLGYRLEVDYFLPSLSLALEFQGPTHFLPMFGEQELQEQRQRDILKQNLCRQHGVVLLEVLFNHFSPSALSKLLTQSKIKHQYSDRYAEACKKYSFMMRKTTKKMLVLYGEDNAHNS